MVAPVTGPFTRTISYRQIYTNGVTVFEPQVFSKTITWSRQRKPHNLPLPYQMDMQFAVGAWGPWPSIPNLSIAVPYNTSLTDSSANKAYSKLVESLGDQSLWAVNLAEHRQGIKLITADAIIIWKFLRELHKFDFPSAARTLKTHIPKGLVPTAKAFGNNFLKFHFGWEPLIKDIGAAVSTLQDPIPPKVVQGRSGKSTVKSVIVTGGSFWIRDDVKTVSASMMRTKVTVSNPNLHLASQLGFVNPLAVAWELVPFSFVVDWFVNVGQFLSQCTDFAGLTLSDSFTTRFQVSDKFVSAYTGRSSQYKSAYVRRSVGISGPTLKVRPWKGVSATRAATAISLLVQQLK